jgi:hypothetical protein
VAHRPWADGVFSSLAHFNIIINLLNSFSITSRSNYIEIKANMTKVQHKLSISIDILQKDKMKAEKDKMKTEKDKLKAMVRAEIADKVLQKILKKRKIFRKRKIFTKS